MSELKRTSHQDGQPKLRRNDDCIKPSVAKDDKERKRLDRTAKNSENQTVKE